MIKQFKQILLLLTLLSLVSCHTNIQLESSVNEMRPCITDGGGGYVGGALGLYSFTEVGAAIGAPFGPGGMIVVGFIGATLGSIVGSYCATQITDRCYGY